MKTAFKLSILLNLVLTGGLAYLALVGRHSIPMPPPVPTVGFKPPAVVAVTALPARLEPVRCYWSQLASTNYHIYVKNLRASGCPEATIRAIVAADVQAVVGRRRRDLDQALAKLESGSLVSQLGSFDAEQKIKADLSTLPDEESSVIAHIMGLPVSPVAVAGAVNPPVRHTPPTPPPALPLALQEVNPALMTLTPEQLEVIAQVRENFNQAVGGLNQDPDDPDYLARWQQAQPQADTMLEGLLGNSFYQNYQMAVAASGRDSATTER
jgi:hypothetical protein